MSVAPEKPYRTSRHRLDTAAQRALGLFVCSGALLACRGETSREPPIVPLRNMYDQPRYNMQEESPFFADGRTMRPPVEGSVSREHSIEAEISEGRTADGSGYILTIPESLVAELGGAEALVQRGQDRYNVYCTPCHAKTGSGDGIVIKHGMQPHPTSFHDERIKHLPDGQIFATISNGIRNMPAYGPQIPVKDRWAIVAYVRALELAKPEIFVAEKKP